MSDTSYPTFQQYGTNAQRTAFTPSPPGGTQPVYLWYETDTGQLWLYSTGWHQLTSSGAVPVILPSTIEGRLTTESGIPVSSSDRTAQGTLYYTPSTSSGVAQTNGNITLYNGSALVNATFTQLSLALTLTSGKNYDVFVDYNSGTPQLVLSAAWTNDTTRADALGVQSGIIIKSGTAAYRWVGTIRASGANVTADAAAFRFVWNAYNQVPRSLVNTPETTDTWNYTTATFRQANSNTANQLAYVTGSASSFIEAQAQATHSNASSNANTATGIGVDSTSVNSAQLLVCTAGIGVTMLSMGTYKGMPGLGYHILPWLELSGATGTTTWFGDAGLTYFQSGIVGTIWA